MTNYKKRIIEDICYTDLAYERINKKLSTDLSKLDIEMFIDEILKNTDEKFYIKTGKNYYVTNTKNHIRITINSNTLRVITVDKVEK